MLRTKGMIKIFFVLKYVVKLINNPLKELTMIKAEITVVINTVQDILTARQKVAWLAKKLGFQGSWPVILSTIISELSRNILYYTKKSIIVIKPARKNDKYGISIIAFNLNNNMNVKETNNCREFLKKYQPNIGKKAAKKFIDEFKLSFGFNNEFRVEIIKWL